MIGATIIWAIAGMIGSALFVHASPILERRLAPVLTDQRIEIDLEDRTEGRMCWTWYWNKRRYAQPLIVSWSLSIEGTAVEVPIITSRERDGMVLRNPQVHAIGQGKNELCAIIPATYDRLTGLVIRGHINYKLPHGLWTMWQELPPVKVPALR